jgi:hypothetical protein
MGVQPGAPPPVAYGQTTRVEQAVCGRHRHGTHVERGRQLADRRELLVVLGRPGLALDGIGDIGRRRPRIDDCSTTI